MALHEVQLKGYSVRPGNLSLGTFDSYGIEQLHVTLDDTWSGLAVTATFNPPKGEPVEIRVPENGLIDVPAEATANEGTGTIVYCGVANGVQLITKTQGYNVITHGNVGGTEPFNPSESLATQVLQAALNAEKNSAEAKSVADGLRNDAASGKFNGKDGVKGDKGDDGTTPQLKIGEDNLWHVSYDNGATWVSLGVKATGAAGKDGADGVTPHIGENGNWWVGDTDTGVSAKGDRGDTGDKGADGVSPTATVTQTDDGAEFTVTDASGTTTATIRNGTDGRDGAPGAPGKDAVVDATLTQDGQAADAKVTGEKISHLEEDTAALKKRQNVLVGSETCNPASCNDAFSAPLCGLTVYGKSTQDGTPTPDAPVPIVSAGDDGSVAVKVTGKNLFPVITNANISKLNKPTGGVRYGYVFHVPAESRVTISGNADIGTNCFIGDFDIKTQTYTQKAQLISEKGGTYATTLQSGWYAVYLANDYLPTILIKLNDAKIQIEIGTKATAYEPYREQLLTLPTPNGLPGIHVPAGGNYTDQNGQQWICDEVDLERGVKVQRVYKIDVDGENSKFEQNGNYANLSTRGIPIASYVGGQQIYAISTFTSLPWYYNTKNGQFLYLIAADISGQINESCKKQLGKVYYALATPIETPLAPAEIAAYKAITAYAPDTVVQASDDAGIKLGYQRDVNLVVKNLEDAIASMTTT